MNRLHHIVDGSNRKEVTVRERKREPQRNELCNASKYLLLGNNTMLSYNIQANALLLKLTTIGKKLSLRPCEFPLVNQIGFAKL